jgi:hypothetical protein
MQSQYRRNPLPYIPIPIQDMALFVLYPLISTPTLPHDEVFVSVFAVHVYLTPKVPLPEATVTICRPRSTTACRKTTHSNQHELLPCCPLRYFVILLTKRTEIFIPAVRKERKAGRWVGQHPTTGIIGAGFPPRRR